MPRSFYDSLRSTSGFLFWCGARLIQHCLGEAFIVLDFIGYATLWMAVFADMGVSLLVVFNGMRLLGFEKRR